MKKIDFDILEFIEEKVFNIGVFEPLFIIRKDR
jgi:hypothetical protein